MIFELKSESVIVNENDKNEIDIWMVTIKNSNPKDRYQDEEIFLLNAIEQINTGTM